MEEGEGEDGRMCLAKDESSPFNKKDRLCNDYE